MDKETKKKVWGAAYVASFIAITIGNASRNNVGMSSTGATSSDIDSAARCMADRMTKTLDDKLGDVL
jgi:hypothetical protein